ncbi:response regulator [Halodesulfurarchaeum sp. HSR-GB]|uniref:response regulator transcription factor n=1 Tax=Halodesulfurarchaeum sp. HSR-GB TaxID=3074077 RepID=UPI0028566015|nr:response regulator [Halodesulfurarchaeum sp. HSR-GB]MDR5657750.1 response regulator [Halodesulfurarchaeum sp. HSR-GB]
MLIVDDEPGLVDLFDLWLTDDYNTVTATTGKTALEKISPSIDAALLDRDLVTMNGSDLATEIRALDPYIPIAFVSGGEPDGDILETGFDDYLVKPIGKSDLLTTLKFFFKTLVSLDDPYRDYAKVLRQQAVINETTNTISKSETTELRSTLQTYRKGIDQLPQEVGILQQIGVV